MAGKPYIKAVRYAKHFPVKGVVARNVKGEWCRNVPCGHMVVKESEKESSAARGLFF